VLGGAGQVECVASASLLQLVIDDDVLGIARKAIRKIEVNDDTLGWEAIAEVGPGGNFLTHAHTLKHCREAFRPKTFVRKPRNVWASEGRNDILDMAKERLNEIRKKHRPAPLSKEVQKELRAILKDADKRLAGKA